MHYPTLKTIPALREAVSVFRGLNRGSDIGDGEFAAMENLCARHYPQAATAPANGAYLPDAQPRGILAKEKLCYAEGSCLVVGQDRYDLSLTDGEKQLISMGAYILILPDKTYFNTADPTDFGGFARSVREKYWGFEPCDRAGTPRKVKFIGDALPEDAQTGDFWCDSSAETPILKQLAANGSWQVTEGFVRLTLDSYRNEKYPYRGYLTDAFSDGDTVALAIEGEIVDAIEEQPMEESYMKTLIAALAGDRKLKLLDGVTAVIPGVMPYTIAIGNYIRLGRYMPEMDFVFECGNRLWGCRYGDQQGRFVNEIYASALGDFRNWSSFQGVATDAYTASVGTDGPFTGAMNYLGYPVFFKENCVHRVYGSYPAEYRIQTTPCAGVAPGCGKSLCLLGDTALYLGKNGVCAYDGAMPSLISRELSGLSGPAAAAVRSQEYFLSVPQGLFVYDSRRRLWHRRAAVEAADLCAWDGRVFYFRLGKPGLMELEAGSDRVAFSMETGLIAGSRQRRIRSICLRYSLTGWGRLMVEYDSSGVWLAVGELPQTRLGWENLPLKPRRCDHFRLKLTGEGCLKIHSIIKTLEEGSDLP